MQPRFGAVLKVLTDAEILFVVVGGLSAIAHGSAHITLDVDILFARGKENVSRLVRALAPYHPRPEGFPPELPFLWDEKTLGNATLFTLNTDLGRIDILAEVSGVGTFEEVWPRSIDADLFGLKVRTLSLPDLIASKKAAGRVKDLQVLPELESLLEAEEE